MQTEKLPNFVLAGPAKSGTTALYYMLRQHPQVFFPAVKEPRFFAYENILPNYNGPTIDDKFNETTIYKVEDYLRLYQDSGNVLAIGDASPIYMHVPRTVETIKKYIPAAKIIIMLRHPAERAYSAYLHFYRDGYENLTFDEALQYEEERIAQNWGIHWRYFQMGKISDQIEKYLDIFGQNQVLFVLYEEFYRDNLKSLKAMFSFIGVDQEFEPKIVRANTGGYIQNRWRHKWLSLIPYFGGVKSIVPIKYRRIFGRWLINSLSKTIEKPTMPYDQFNRLTKLYEEEILKTQTLTKLDLSDWLTSIH